MVEILPLPVRPHGTHQFDRLHADLAAAHERGTDLGPRAPHIQAGGDRLLELTSALERAIEELDLTVIKLGLQYPNMREALRDFVIKTESLANTAQSFAHTVHGLAGLAQRFPATL
ncbi:hypothetical protein [Methylobacterium radiotolerans]|uniref:Uncharacterized protein n=1 Tax=Methylobacterium radiotolerans (strain ATCC 27329 / DSM 1819 / JCM 2831 / NBRC 15690 / NCIMB 10815 / 0-1) TaxID=426355 RepID=B1M1Q4_METRJ|nr:hypothetical protein [Methylobacterium radiotolerans]ACB27637.1 conserved hypothetical protein [Methylobacterium radiotolerans JCM 2831]GEM95920.1 hypothetical protein MRA01_04600 [Methylobacterium radiotolerans]